MVDLYCAESLSLSSKHAYPDPAMFAPLVIETDDGRQQAAAVDCLKSLHTIEHVWTPSVNYFENKFQPDLKPYMRLMVVEWVLEVCKEQHCEEEVYPVTVNLIDRFLSVQQIPKTEFQLLASACLLVASKLRETASLPAEKICKYTENSISLDQLYAYEMFVLDRLQWDLGVITSHEMCDHLMYRLFSDSTAPNFYRIRRHARALLDLSQTDFACALQPPSLLAASAIMASMLHLGFTDEYHPEGDNSDYHKVGEIVEVHAEWLAQWSIKLIRLRNAFIAKHQHDVQTPGSSVVSSPDSGVESPFDSPLNSTATSSSTTTSNKSQQQQSSSLHTTPVRTSGDGDEAHPQTPTDVADLFDD